MHRPGTRPCSGLAGGAFALATSIAIALLLGLAPGLGLVRRDLAGVLRGRAGRGRSHPRFGAALVVGQVALTSLLLVGAGLLLLTFDRLADRELGFDPDRVLSIWLEPAPSAHTVEAAPIFIERILTEVGQIPGVEAASVDLCTPLMATCASTTATIPSSADTRGREQPTARHYVAPDHFRALGVPVLRGRGLTEDDRRGGPRVAVVSVEAARRFWPDEDPLGKTFWLGDGAAFGADSAFQVVGVVGDVRYGSVDRVYVPNVYTSYREFTWPYTYLFVRSGLSTAELVPRIRAAVAQVDPALPLFDVRSLRERLRAALGRPRFNAVLAGSFGLLALALAMVGIHGVMARYVSERRKELGIRMALGARSSGVVWIVLGRSLVLAGAGAILGIAGTIALGRVMASFLFGVQPWEPVLLTLVILFLCGATLLSSWAPARRATRVDPGHVLRAD